ncbi:MAG: hypothetical protein COA32_04460 [Fluviicola sp.]|nr:MAG: hypothetical protein COA32_04460 [Fluviicola sp.]
MKSKKVNVSLWGFLICALLAVVVRFNYHTNNSVNGYNATTWDALGYYIYLPSTFIYQDATQLDWFPAIDSTYNVSGGTLYQATLKDDGNYVFKYLGGVAIMEIPFFVVGHVIASNSDYPADGFSAPYQYSIIWGAVFWFLFGLWYLRKVLLVYFSETITTLTLILVVGASNLLQYVSVDGAMSHSFIFPLYALLLWWTIQWHKKPKKKFAFAIGLIIGIATISRPTEFIMIFIPILWMLPDSKNLKSKWKLVGEHRVHILFALVGGIIGIFPQLLYWKLASGDWIYNVGSKWFFLNPWWRVLFGFEKGWFIYTPIAIFFILGLFFLKGKPFRKSVIVFTLLNIWIIISWSDWQYGASYSTRALTQSYPILALPLAAFLQRIFSKKWSPIVIIAGAYLIFVNLFQIWQYNAGIIHYRDMNRQYYSAIYLDHNPTLLDYSLLDTGEQLPEQLIGKSNSKTAKSISNFELDAWESEILHIDKNPKYTWISGELELTTNIGLENGRIVIASLKNNKIIKQRVFRLTTPFSKNKEKTSYQFHYKSIKNCDEIVVKLESLGNMNVKEASLTLDFYN